jgi:hypothetical protein
LFLFDYFIYILIRHRLTIHGIPTYDVTYTIGGTIKHFWVYGTTKKVYAPGYPLSKFRIFLVFLLFAVFIGAIAGFGVFMDITREYK